MFNRISILIQTNNGHLGYNAVIAYLVLASLYYTINSNIPATPYECEGGQFYLKSSGQFFFSL